MIDDRLASCGNVASGPVRVSGLSMPSLIHSASGALEVVLAGQLLGLSICYCSHSDTDSECVITHRNSQVECKALRITKSYGGR
jgi:hypothetical protein